MRPASAAERQFLAASGAVSEAAKLRAMARTGGGGARTSLIELQAVDAAYPLYGTVALAPAGPLTAALAPRDGIFGAVAEAALARRLGLAVGDSFRIGDATVRLAAIIEREPDAAFGGLAFGPRVIVARPALAATRLIQPGALVDYEYRLRLPPGADRRPVDRPGARAVPARRLAVAQHRRRRAVVAAADRPSRVFPEPRRDHRACSSAGSASPTPSPATSPARRR